jgi:hypothetical protein
LAQQRHEASGQSQIYNRFSVVKTRLDNSGLQGDELSQKIELGPNDYFKRLLGRL